MTRLHKLSHIIFGFGDDSAQHARLEGIPKAAGSDELQKTLAAPRSTYGHIVAYSLLAVLARFLPDLQRAGFGQHVIDVVERRVIDVPLDLPESAAGRKL